MESTYAILREFAGSWMLLFMMVFFVGAVLFAFRPGSGREHRDIANSIFRNEHAPADGPAQTPAQGSTAQDEPEEGRT